MFELADTRTTTTGVIAATYSEPITDEGCGRLSQLRPMRQREGTG